MTITSKEFMSSGCTGRTRREQENGLDGIIATASRIVSRETSRAPLRPASLAAIVEDHVEDERLTFSRITCPGDARLNLQRRDPLRPENGAGGSSPGRISTAFS
jgi:hypothetical protein